MKTRILYIIVMFICLFDCYSVCADALEKIYSNKEIYYSMFNHTVGTTQKRLYRFNLEQFFLDNKDKNFDFWKKNRDNFYTAFFNSIEQICFFQKDGASVVDDSLYILLLIEMLYEPTYSEITLGKLTHNTSYELLNTFSIEIKTVI